MQETMTGRPSRTRTVVLVVDDDVELLSALRLALEPGGFEVLAASNPFLAVRMAASCEPDIIVLDLDMPGMDGMEAARHLKRIEQTRRTPIVAFTGAPLASIEFLERCGFDRVVSKTDGLESLAGHVENLIRRSAGAASVE